MFIINKFNSKENKKNKQQQQNQQNQQQQKQQQQIQIIQLNTIIQPQKNNIKNLLIASLIIEWMKKNNAYDTNGIFRVNGELKIMNLVKEIINKNQTIPDEFNFDPHSIISVGSVLKDVLRELSEPLFTNKLFKLFMDAFTKINDYYSKVFILKILYYSLPKPNKDFTKDLFAFLKKIAEKSETNQMTEHNLATVIAPNILYNNTYSDTEIFKHYITSNSVIELLLDEYYYIFEDTPYLVGNKDVPNYIKQLSFLKKYCTENKDFIDDIKVSFLKYPYVNVNSSFPENEPTQIPVFIKKEGDQTFESHQLEWQLSLPTNMVVQNKQQSFLSSHHKANTNKSELLTPPLLKNMGNRPQSFMGHPKLNINEEISTSSYESSSTTNNINNHHINNINNINNLNGINSIQNQSLSSSSGVDHIPNSSSSQQIPQQQKTHSPPTIRRTNTNKNPIRHSVNITNLKDINNYNNQFMNNNISNNRPILLVPPSTTSFNSNNNQNIKVEEKINKPLNQSLNLQHQQQQQQQKKTSNLAPYYPPPPPVSQTRVLLNRTTSLFAMSLQNNNNFN